MSVTSEYENIKKQVQSSLPKGTTRSTASQVMYILSTEEKSIDIKVKLNFLIKKVLKNTFFFIAFIYNLLSRKS